MGRSRYDRLAEALDGTEYEPEQVLTWHPVIAEAVTRMLTAARRAGGAAALAHDKELRARRKREKARYREDHAEGFARFGAALGRRAGEGRLETLEELQRFLRYAGPDALQLAVDGARARGFSDREIGDTLGISREAVGQRFGRRGSDALPEAERESAVQMTWTADSLPYSAEAKTVIRAIADDMAALRVPTGVSRFEELHEHVDANMYLADALGMPEDPRDDAWDEFIARCDGVSAEVDRWLAAPWPRDVPVG